MAKKLDKMKFDVVIGNPPYNTKNRGGLWVKFVDVAKKLCKSKIVYITPTSLVLNPNRRFKNCRKNIGHMIESIDFEANKYFDVGDDICWWIADVNRSGLTEIVIDNESHFHDCSELFVIPTDANKNLMSILEHIQAVAVKKGFVQANTLFGKCSGKKSNDKFKWSTQKDEIFSQCVRYGMSKTNNFIFVQTEDAPEEITKKWKVLINRSGNYYNYSKPNHYIKVEKDTFAGDLAWHIVCETEEEARNAFSFFTSKLMYFLGEHGTFGSNKAFKDHVGSLWIPSKDILTSKNWTNDEVYKFFELTSKHITHIEEFIK